MEFTNEQLKWFESYLKVQKSGKYNMILESDLASISAGLTHAQYKFVINNYNKLYEQYYKGEK